ncbi:MAG TPA: phage holin family protein [Terriglobia bacterium]|nr:phage holin family protein [Terriglobia bacterium]
MTRLLVRWFISAVALLVVARMVPGFHVRGLGSALLAALVIGFVNGTLGLLLKVLTLPFTILTLGLFLLVVNALMLEFSAWLVPGFAVRGFAAAFWGALILSLIHLLTRQLYKEGKWR